MSPLTPSDLELARLASPGTPDAQLVVQLAQRTLAELATEPPISHEIVASMRDVIRIDEEDIPWPGCLTYTVDGLVITLRRSDSRGRKPFTAFHEILHTFLPGFAMHTQFRCEPAGTQPTEAQPRDRDIETLCDVGAAELLFPRGPFSADLADAPATFELVEQLATRYDASVEATARRVVSLHPRPALLLVLASTRKPSDPHAPPAPRVRSAQSSGSWPYVPRYKSVPRHGLLSQALQGEKIDEIASSLGDLTTPPITDVRISARPYPYTDDRGENHMRVLALITSANSPSPHNVA